MTDLRVLVVEDDHALRDVVARALREEGYTVVTAADGSSALATVARLDPFELAVLDIGLPDSDGRDLCQALRGRGFTAPVLFLTARGELSDRLTGFAAGGDDYLTKPFHVAELLARLRALAKRRPEPGAAPAHDVRLDPAEHALISPTGRSDLTPTEYRLLGCLLAAPGTVVRRREFRQAGWPDDDYVSDNSIDQAVTRLRRKLAAISSAGTIETVRGVGYRFS
ncbi:response regulator transcription factor [Cryptosporangium phraense]|uniref:Response regulator transcription factor n=1 Tax=Cryptosporangium phraense TaxID=2593070 RepID=A0A545AQ15_9ACTN|nr:response regulator transcription factor [Cryptosporangium phraense]TQS43360.1 response regulator transcription factor [Cryptosporangium phraense]